MQTNFDFLRKVNNNLYNIITDAEKLYRDEYFEQCIVQTRRFGEQICKIILQENGQQTGSFDDMLATLKDKSQGSIQEKEFIQDLYFLKQNGNKAVHSIHTEKQAMTALECLKRSFETAISFSVYTQGAPKSILRLNYDVEKLITDTKSKQSLAEKYKKAKSTNAIQNVKNNNPIINKNKPEKQLNTEKSKSIKLLQIKIPLFWKFIIFLSFISFSVVILLSIYLYFAENFFS